MQTFDVAQILPNLYAVGAAAVVPSILARTQNASPLLQSYGMMGELVRVCGIGGVFALIV